MPCDVLLKKPVEKLVPGAVYCDVHDAKNPNFLNLNDSAPESIPKLCERRLSYNSPPSVKPGQGQTIHTEPVGALLANIRSLICRNRFPVGDSKLPLKSLCEKTNFVSFKILQPEHGSLTKNLAENNGLQIMMLCYKTRSCTIPYEEIPLYGAEMVAKTFTELGPFIYLISQKGIHQFGCPTTGSYNYQFWESQMSFLGVRIIMPHDLFVLTSSQPLGEGSFAKVFTAIHRSTGKSIVIKRMPKNRVPVLPPDQQSAAQLEIGILRKISHPYVVKFELAYEDDNYQYIVLEKLRGGTVNHWLREHKRMTEFQASQVIERILLVLVELQARNIVHRDLKPENLVLQNPNDPTSLKIIDFGLAAYLNTSRMNMFCGSPGFVAPEIIEKQPYGKGVDMFSVGVLLYVFLSGKTPFHAGRNTPSITLLRNKICKISFESQVWKDISVEARDFITALLQKDPKKRISLENALDSPWLVRSRIPTIPMNCLSKTRRQSNDEKPQSISSKNDANNSKNFNIVRPNLCNLPNRQKIQTPVANKVLGQLDTTATSFKTNRIARDQNNPIYFYPELINNINHGLLHNMDTTETETDDQFHHAIGHRIYNPDINFFKGKKMVVSLSHQLECS